jgi:hypothetical protein
MKIAVDFDGTIVSQDRPYEDVETPLEFLPGAKEALIALKRAGHILILYSSRANLALRDDWHHDPLYALGVVPFNEGFWRRNLPINQARFEQMVKFVEKELPGVFSAIDYGNQGKVSADLYIDDRALRVGRGPGAVTWDWISQTYGAKSPAVRYAASRRSW